jgi:hypothetical protein
VHEHGVAVAHERQQFLELGSGGVLPRHLVGEHPVNLDPVELADGVLVDAADPDIPDPHRPGPRSPRKCQAEL